MKTFTIKYHAIRYIVKPIMGHFQRFKVNINGQEVFFEPDLDGFIRAEAKHGINMALLLGIAEMIQRTVMV